MTWTIGLCIFAAGLFLGWLITRYTPILAGKHHQLNSELKKQQSESAQLKEEMDSCLNKYANTMSNIAEQAANAAEEAKQQQQKLLSQNAAQNEDVAYFGVDKEHLLQSSDNKSTSAEKVTDAPSKAAPLDYSNDKMGIFSEQESKSK